MVSIPNSQDKQMHQQIWTSQMIRTIRANQHKRSDNWAVPNGSIDILVNILSNRLAAREWLIDQKLFHIGNIT